jgi:hypothetical protein
MRYVLFIALFAALPLLAELQQPQPVNPPPPVVQPTTTKPKSPRTLKDLDPDVVEELTLEQTLNSRAADPNVFNDLNDFQKVIPKNMWPENQPTIPLKTYLLKPKDVDVYSVEPLPPELVLPDGRIRYLVHPLSDSQYATHSYFKRRDTEPSKFLASPYASHRSMLAWDQTTQDPEFGLKVSLNVEIGGLVRNLSANEIKRTVAVSALLKTLDQKEWRKSGVNFVIDPVGIVPKGIDAGMLLRTTPKPPKGIKIVPLFALFTKPADGTEPMVVQLARKSGMAPLDFIKAYFIKPMNDQAAERYFEEGMVWEDHEQNTLAEINLAKGQLNKKFWYRDLGAVHIDEIARHAAGKDMSFLPAWADPKHIIAKEARGFLARHTMYVRDSVMYSLSKTMQEYFPEVTVNGVKKMWQDNLVDVVAHYVELEKYQFRYLIHGIEDWRKANVPPGGKYRSSINAEGCVGVLSRVWGEI